MVWAPFAGYLMTVMYKGKLVKWEESTFFEEIFPFTDFIPSHSLGFIPTLLKDKFNIE
jgi:hypothetical protein